LQQGNEVSKAAVPLDPSVTALVQARRSGLDQVQASDLRCKYAIRDATTVDTINGHRVTDMQVVILYPARAALSTDYRHVGGSLSLCHLQF